MPAGCASARAPVAANQTLSSSALNLQIQFRGMALTQQDSRRIIGVDPGLNITGYGVIDFSPAGATLCEAGIIRLPAARGRNLPARLESLFAALREVLREFKPQAMCLEEVYSHAVYPQTAVLMGHARGVICLAAQLEAIPVVSLSAKRIKQSVTGNGNASKLQVQRAVKQMFMLHYTPHPPDVADALAAALCLVNMTRLGRLAPDLAATRRPA